MKRSVFAVLIVCVCAAYVLLSALTELTSSAVAHQSAEEYAKLTSLAPLAVTHDLKIKSAKGKYRYKTDSPEDAEQMWLVTAETPTAYSSFDQISTIRMRGRQTGKPDSLDHQFAVKPSGITAGGKAYKGRFFPWDNVAASGNHVLSSGSHHKYACGIFKAKLVPDTSSGLNRLVFLYAVTSASRLGELSETNHFEEMKSFLADAKKTNGVITTEYAMSINGLEQHDGSSQATFKGATKNGTGKLLKTPPPASN